MQAISDANRKWWLLGAVSCVLGLVLLDETVVGIALPTIQKELGLSNNDAHWVVNAYLLTFACFVAVGGKVADLFGILRVFLFGLALFAICSVACGFAPSGGALIAARALQGLGAAIIFPLFLAMITITFPKDVRGAALATSGAVGTTFLALGPLVGGLFTDFLSWRWIFWINPFVAVVVAVLVTLTWRDVPRPAGRQIDWIGLLLMATAMFCVVFGLMEASDLGWRNPLILASMFLGLVLFGLFWRFELRQSMPLIEVDLFSSPVFAGSNLTIFTAQYAKMPLFVFVALYAQTDLHLTPFQAGVVVMLAPALQPITAVVCGRYADKIAKRWQVLFGLGVLTLAFLWQAVTWSYENVFLFVPGLLIAGLAFPFLFTPTRAAVSEALPEHKHGQGGGIAMTSQIAGGTVGLAVSSAAFALGGFGLVFALTALLSTLVFIYAAFAFRGA
ncbi:Multidrug resistance protein stp [Labrenzia sp. THAF82]|uniref:MFS transporter n=1 Tax=Labrenzia sp. THAF82 TaxID=2587861 RepID=UPI001268427A|nr:MFS transporter [Labrenzia sp. THAF82]QFT30148.1 Multidrug resistance protein stp [Labrenzia sp. THAF82]